MSTNPKPSPKVTRKWLLWLGAVPFALLLLGYGLWVGVAVWRGEHFYAGRPTSYWRASLRGWAWVASSSRPWAAVSERSFAGKPIALHCLPAVARGSPDAVPVLRELLRDGNGQVQLHAVDGLRAVGQAGGDLDAVAAALADALDDGDARVRWFAFEGLRDFARHPGPARTVVTQALRKAAGSPDAELRRDASAALRVLVPEVAREAGIE